MKVLVPSGQSCQLSSVAPVPSRSVAPQSRMTLALLLVLLVPWAKSVRVTRGGGKNQHCHTWSGSYRLGGPRSGTKVGPSEMSLKIFASTGPERCRLSLPQTCHQKYSSREAVGSTRRRNVVVYTSSCQLMAPVMYGTRRTTPEFRDFLGRHHSITGDFVIDASIVENKPFGQQHRHRF